MSMKKENDMKFYPFLIDKIDNSKHKTLIITFIAILMSLIVISILLLILGQNPFNAFTAFLQGSGFVPKSSYGNSENMFTDFLAYLGILTPMIFGSLSVVTGYKAGLVNIGVSGQMLLSAFIATVLVGYSNLGPVVSKLLAVIIGIVVGGLAGVFVGFLKYKFNIHEVVSTTMLNYIFSFVIGFFINNYYVDPFTRHSKAISKNASLTLKSVEIGGMKMNIPLGFILALFVVFFIYFLFKKTTLGFEIRMVGANKRCSFYSGVNIGKTMIIAMAISGALAGLAGICYYMGYYNAIPPNQLPGIGYDAVAVSLLGNIHPIGCLFASIFIMIFQNGSIYMSSKLGIAKEISAVIIGIVLIFCACSQYFKYLIHKENERLQKRESEKLAKEES